MVSHIMHIFSQVGAWMQLSRPAEASSPTPRSTSDVATTRASNQFQGLPTKARYLCGVRRIQAAFVSALPPGVSPNTLGSAG